MNLLNQQGAQADLETVKIARINAWSFRQPIDRPVHTSFGTMHDRPAVFVRLEDTQGNYGWGEVFANWPAAGAEHRVNLLKQDIAEIVIGKEFSHPSQLFFHLDEVTSIRALQCGEWGPFRQVIAGLDIAIWDLFSRRENLPLRRFLNPSAVDQVPAYASGIHIDSFQGSLAKNRQLGFKTFKVKVGFDVAREGQLMADLCASLTSEERVGADANQAWDLETAQKFMTETADLNLMWLEEPIRADASPKDWQRLSDTSSMPLAAGENIAGFASFSTAIFSGTLDVVQPDIAKWGGITGCQYVALQAVEAGRRYCPHFLGGGIGLAASAELLAAIGGDGVLEVDVNENQLRDAFRSKGPSLIEGNWPLKNLPGIGVETLPESIGHYLTHSF